MNQVARVKIFQELFELINIYFDERDLPTKDNFFERLEACCLGLELDIEELKKSFGIKKWDEMLKDGKS